MAKCAYCGDRKVVWVQGHSPSTTRRWRLMRKDRPELRHRCADPVDDSRRRGARYQTRGQPPLSAHAETDSQRVCSGGPH